MAQKPNYWLEKRAIETLVATELKGEQALNKVLPLYRSALQDIRVEINKIYVKYSDKTGLDVSELSHIIEGSDRANFIKSIQLNMRKLGFNLADVYDPNYIARLSRLDALKSQIYWRIMAIAPQERDITGRTYADIVQTTYLRTNQTITEGYGVKNGIAESFAMLDNYEINAILGERWAGRNYAISVWSNTEALASRLPELLGGDLTSGVSYNKTIATLRREFDVTQYQARRLAITESAHFSNQAELQSYIDQGIEYYKFSAILDNKTSKICETADKLPPIRIDEAIEGENYPPLHPHCRSTTYPVLNDNPKTWATKPRQLTPDPDPDVQLVTPTGQQATVPIQPLLPTQIPQIPMPSTNLLPKPNIYAGKTLEDTEAMLRQLELRGNIEQGVAFRNGKPIAEFMGSNDALRITKEQMYQLKDATITHNHPNANTAFSREDFYTALTSNAKEIRAVASDVTYSLKRTGDTWFKTRGIDFDLLDRPPAEGLGITQNRRFDVDAFEKLTRAKSVELRDQAIAEVISKRVAKGTPEFNAIISKYGDKASELVWADYAKQNGWTFEVVKTPKLAENVNVPNNGQKLNRKNASKSNDNWIDIQLSAKGTVKMQTWQKQLADLYNIEITAPKRDAGRIYSLGSNGNGVFRTVPSQRKQLLLVRPLKPKDINATVQHEFGHLMSNVMGSDRFAPAKAQVEYSYNDPIFRGLVKERKDATVRLFTPTKEAEIVVKEGFGRRMGWTDKEALDGIFNGQKVVVDGKSYRFTSDYYNYLFDYDEVLAETYAFYKTSPDWLKEVAPNLYTYAQNFEQLVRTKHNL